jgi:hypothetical protein
MKKEVTPKNAKGLVKKTSDEKRGNPKKCKRARSKDIRWKKRQPRETQRGSLKRPPMKKEPTLKSTKGLIQKNSDEKWGNPEKTQWQPGLSDTNQVARRWLAKLKCKWHEGDISQQNRSTAMPCSKTTRKWWKIRQPQEGVKCPRKTLLGRRNRVQAVLKTAIAETI